MLVTKTIRFGIILLEFTGVPTPLNAIWHNCKERHVPTEEDKVYKAKARYPVIDGRQFYTFLQLVHRYC